MTEELVIGIDFGTSYCSGAIYNGDKVEIIENECGHRFIDSCVVFTSSQIIVGNTEIFRNNNTDNGYLINGVKRLIGLNSGDREDIIDSCEYDVIHKDEHPKIQVPFKGQIKQFSPEALTVMVLEKMRNLAEVKYEKPISKAVISVPNHFNYRQRQATIEAANLAGLEVLQILNDTSATAIAYREQNCKDTSPKNILVYDFGGGSFDVSILHLKHNVIFVEATNGDSHLGGYDLDTCLMDHFIDEFRIKHLQDLRTSKKSLQLLRIICEGLKKKLSVSQYAEFDVDLIHDGIKYRSGISRNKFEELTKDIFEKTMDFVTKTIRDAEMKKEDIQEVLLVGRCTYIPKVKEMFNDYFNTHLVCNFNPEETVVCGAAIQAALLSTSPPKQIANLLIIDVNTFGLSVKTDTGNIRNILPKNSYIPTRRWFSYPIAKDNESETTMYAMYEENGENERYLTDIFTIIPCTAQSEADEIEIAFEYDINGIIKVTSTQTDTSNNSKIDLPIVWQKDYRKQKEEALRLRTDEIHRLVQEEIKECENENYLENYLENIKQAVGTFDDLRDEEKFELKIKSKEIHRFLSTKETLETQLNDTEKYLRHLCEIAMEFIKHEEQIKNITVTGGQSLCAHIPEFAELHRYYAKANGDGERSGK
ncbi:Heat shock protein 70 cognate 2 [Carabus blaptoides fortunei]